MNLSKWRITLFLSFITTISIFIFLSYDKNELLYLIYEEEEPKFGINEVDMSKKEKIVSTERPTLVTNSVPVNKWVLPVERDYTITTYYNNSHKAVDLYSYKGYNSRIMAANSGEVIGAYSNCNNQGSYCNGRRGNYVVIKHYVNNYYTVYMHLNKINVKKGDKVNSGDTIATMGNTGYVIPVRTAASPYNGTHLHFCLFVGEPYNGGYPINPMRLY